MALLKYGGGIVGMSGSIAGNTFARNRYGNYSRTRTKPVNAKSSGQVLIRSIMSYLAEAWHEQLSASQRTAWATYANAISMKNRLGEAIKLSGFNMFIRSNAMRLQWVQPLVKPGPTTLSLPPTDPLFAITAAASTQLISVTFDNTMDWANAQNNFMCTYMGRPQLLTRNFFGGPWKLNGGKQGSTPPPTSPFTFTATFTLIAGQRIWVYARISMVDGRLSTKFQDDVIVSA
jgi:hypothetical protein